MLEKFLLLSFQVQKVMVKVLYDPNHFIRDTSPLSILRDYMPYQDKEHLCNERSSNAGPS